LGGVLPDPFIADVEVPFGWAVWSPRQVDAPAPVHVNLIVGFEDEADAVIKPEVADAVVPN
jgi:hypothetical protein